jgi:hypothetical protein
LSSVVVVLAPRRWRRLAASILRCARSAGLLRWRMWSARAWPKASSRGSRRSCRRTRRSRRRCSRSGSGSWHRSGSGRAPCCWQPPRRGSRVSSGWRGRPGSSRGGCPCGLASSLARSRAARPIQKIQRRRRERQRIVTGLLSVNRNRGGTPCRPSPLDSLLSRCVSLLRH